MASEANLCENKYRVVAHCPMCGEDVVSPLGWKKEVPPPWLWKCDCYGAYVLSQEKYEKTGLLTVFDE